MATPATATRGDHASVDRSAYECAAWRADIDAGMATRVAIPRSAEVAEDGIILDCRDRQVPILENRSFLLPQ